MLRKGSECRRLLSGGPGRASQFPGEHSRWSLESGFRRLGFWSSLTSSVTLNCSYKCWALSSYLKWGLGNSLVGQWLGLRASTAGGTGSIPGQGTKIPHATQCGQKFFKNQKNKQKLPPIIKWGLDHLLPSALTIMDDEILASITMGKGENLLQSWQKRSSLSPPTAYPIIGMNTSNHVLPAGRWGMLPKTTDSQQFV